MFFSNELYALAYHPTLAIDDVEQFATRIAHLVEANLLVKHTHLKEPFKKAIDKGERLFDFGYPTTFKMDMLQEADSFFAALNIVLSERDKKDVYVVFRENGVVELIADMAPYFDSWESFMKKLYSIYIAGQDDERSMDRILKIYELGEDIAIKLRIDRLVYCLDGNYPFEQGILFENTQVANFEEIIDETRKQDGLISTAYWKASVMPTSPTNGCSNSQICSSSSKKLRSPYELIVKMIKTLF